MDHWARKKTRLRPGVCGASLKRLKTSSVFLPSFPLSSEPWCLYQPNEFDFSTRFAVLHSKFPNAWMSVLHTTWNAWKSVFRTTGGNGPFMGPLPTKLYSWIGRISRLTIVTHPFYLTMVINKLGFLLVFLLSSCCFYSWRKIGITRP